MEMTLRAPQGLEKNI